MSFLLPYNPNFAIYRAFCPFLLPYLMPYIWAVFGKAFKEAWSVPSCLCLLSSLLGWRSGEHEGWGKVCYHAFNFCNQKYQSCLSFFFLSWEYVLVFNYWWLQGMFLFSHVPKSYALWNRDSYLKHDSLWFLRKWCFGNFSIFKRNKEI